MNALELVEVTAFFITYTLLVVTIFLQYVCFKRNLETLETILFTFSLLFLIITLSISPLTVSGPFSKFTEFLKLVSYVAVGLTTPINIFKERELKVSPLWNKLLTGTAAILALGCFAAYFMNLSGVMQYPAVLFLGISVAGSMALVLFTKPVKRHKHSEKTDKYFAVAFMVLVPFTLVISYALDGSSLKTGITLPVVFILLAGNKLLDDIQRLSLLQPKIKPDSQSLQSYLLTEREKEIAELLIQGKTYKDISENLFISVPTVKSHAGNIYRKCGVNSRAELTALSVS